MQNMIIYCLQRLVNLLNALTDYACKYLSTSKDEISGLSS